MGSETDIDGFVGFTHLMEHLIFTGSVNYPDEHQIEKIINKYQGEHNGVTKAFATSFFYKIHKEGMEEFIPALADAINSPTFTEENIAKEINNVNSEISMRMTFNKNMAYYKLLKMIGNVNSKLFQDGFSNIDQTSLNIAELKAKLHEFHQKYYSSNLMTLVIIADVDFRQLKKTVESNFDWIKNKKADRPFYNQTQQLVLPFPNEVFGRIFYIQGFTQPSKFTLTFVCPNIPKKAGFHPLEFVSIFINYYSENSFKQTLIKKNLITAFSDSVVLQDYVNALYVITFSLTDYGLKHTSDILGYFFHFIETVKNVTDKTQIFEDLAKVSKFSFLFGIKGEFMDFSHTQDNYFDRVQRFSETLLDHSPEEVFLLNHVYSNFNQTEMDATLESFKPDKAIYMIESQKYKLEEKIRNPKKDAKNEPAFSQTIPKKTTRQNRKLHSLKLIEHSKEEDDRAVQSFLSLKTQQSLVSLKQERILSEYTFDEQTNEIEETRSYNTYLDKTTDTVTLPFEFNFDNGRRYNYANINPDELSQISQKSKLISQKYETCKSFNTNFLEKYQMITKCKTPKSLNSDRIIQRLPLDKLLAYINTTDEDGVISSQGLSTQQIFKAVFNDESLEMDTRDRLTIIRDLTAYKYCLVKEFELDDEREQAELVHQSQNLSVYHHIFRKTLQPKNVITITIESQMVIKSITSSNYQERIRKTLIMEILCLYMTRHVEFEHRQEYVKGNDFSCRIENFRVVLEFEGMSSQLDVFILKVLSSLQSLTFSQTYKVYVLENYKKRIIDMYSQFNSISSLKLSLFYLNLVMDKIFIDNSSPEKIEAIRRNVMEISSEDLATVMEHFFTDNRVYVLGVGNVNEETVSDLGQRAKNLLSTSSAPALSTYDYVDFRHYMFENFVTKIEYDEHLMLRLENNDKNESNSVYLTYFRIKKMSREVKLKAMIMNHFLTKVVYGELRNKLNLGYVAQAGLKVYYHVI